MSEAADSIRDALFARFGERLAVDESLPGLDELARMATRRVCRSYQPRDVAPDLVRLL